MRTCAHTTHIMCLTPSLHPCQGHLLAARTIGDIYNWGKGVAKDYSRAMAAYKVGGEGGDAMCQHMVGMMYYHGFGVAVGYTQARAWFEKAAAQHQSNAVGMLGVMYDAGLGVTPSWRRARVLFERAIELGSSRAVEYMLDLTTHIPKVGCTSRLFIISRTASRNSYPMPRPSLLPRTHRSPPSWTSGWRFTARAAPT